MSAYLDAPTPLAFAHRGGAAAGDENTAEAFARAVGLGYRFVETDVHATADGVPVVFHDATLARLTGSPGAVSSMTWADLSQLRVGGASAVPRLDDILGAWPEVRFNVDLKAADVVAPAVEVIKKCNASARVLLASFSDARLATARALAGPSIATSMGQRAVTRLRLASLSRFRKSSRPRGWTDAVVAAQVPVRSGPVRVVDTVFLSYAHQLGLQVHVWTIDDPAEINRLLDLGVDGIMTDDLTALKTVYESRNLWPA
ncbi:glycerophosphodiester phosphodiesterase family protein [Actinoplanes sp. NPDC051470]|uniref:glycerophosphodiester phosphodiesterase family protein n=1 Tax=Actinoplanes sp. NPDC051470 TaxID=3157224 RepID=UPI00342DFF69